MGAFFRQVAARALLPSSGLRSAGSLPFAAARDSIGEELPVSGVSPAPAAGRPAANPGSPSEERPARGAGVSDAPAARGTRTRSARARTKPHAKPARAPRPSAARVARRPAERKSPSAIVPRQEPPVPTAPVKTPISPPPSGTPPRQRTRRSNPRKPPAQRRTVAPAVRAARVPVRGTRAATARVAATANAPIEVSIHIGRIELTALTKTPARTQADTAAKRPMTLDEYLQRRSRGTGAP